VVTDHICQVCRKQFPTEAASQQHLRICINAGRKLKVAVLRLTDEEVLACQAPVFSAKIEDPELHGCQMCGEQLKSAEFLKSHVDLHLTPILGEVKCAFGNCCLIFNSPVILKKHREEHYQALQIVCDLCGAIYHLKNEMQMHMKRRHIPLAREFACDVPGCSLLCITRTILREHQRNVHRSTVSTCHMCGKITKAYCLKSHLVKHNTETPGVYRCIRRNCKKRFKNGEEIRKHTKEAHEVFKPFQCNMCGKSFPTKAWIRGHIVWHIADRKFSCDVKGCSCTFKTRSVLRRHKRNQHSHRFFTCCYCGVSYTHEDSYKQHLQRHEIYAPGLFKCLHPCCKKTFTKALELRKHYMGQHGNRDIVKQFACQVCGQLNSSKLLLNKHMLQHQVGKIACPTPGCTFFSNSFIKMHLHMNRVHILQCQKTCQLCGQGCYSAAQFQQHEDAHRTGTEGTYKCLHGECQETFSVPLELRTHMKQHIGIIECDVPDCIFTSKSQSDLQLHKIMAHSIWPHNCQLCGQGFDGSKNLKNHMKCHETGDPGFIKCTKSKCQKTFTAGINFKQHVESHKIKSPQVKNCSFLNFVSSVNPHRKADECPLCGKIIKDRHHLQVHVAKHETETPGVLKCIRKECQQQTFTSSSELKNHAAQHWDFSLRPFACDFPGCKYASISNATLVVHKRIMHSSALWDCSMCDKKFKNKSYIKRHIMKVHHNHKHVDNSSSSGQDKKMLRKQHKSSTKMRLRKRL
jgi:KRAB domain-containing zinc finger protein